MKEKIYTIPVNEAFENPGECAFCALNQKLNEEVLRYATGAAYMEEDVRGEMDAMGFCREHYKEMHRRGNRLGNALMLQTRTNYLEKQMQEMLKAAEKKGALKEPEKDTCYICNRMENRMQSYIHTFFHLWKKEPEFRQKVCEGKGFCMPHFTLLLTCMKEQLSKKECQAFACEIGKVQQRHLAKLKEDIERFVQKFDYRNKDMPLNGAEDAVERGIQFASSGMMKEKEEEA